MSTQELNIGDHVWAAVTGGPGFTGVVLDTDESDALIECDQCAPNTAHFVPITDVQRITERHRAASDLTRHDQNTGIYDDCACEGREQRPHRRSYDGRTDNHEPPDDRR